MADKQGSGWIFLDKLVSLCGSGAHGGRSNPLLYSRLKDKDDGGLLALAGSAVGEQRSSSWECIHDGYS
jgi:hypothetical protein